MKYPSIITIIVAAIIGAFVGSFTTFELLRLQKPKTQTANDLINEFYQIENAVHLSPHSLRKLMDKGNKSYILVDLRSPQEYEKEHIITAINIPTYKDPETSAYDEKDRIIEAFRQLPKDKDIIVYCYSMPCMTGRKIGLMLAEKDIFVKHLGIGWNEWRYYWNLWNHDGEKPTKPEDYVASGKEPVVPKEQNLPSSCGEGDLGC